jgi:hypothetical protein
MYPHPTPQLKNKNLPCKIKIWFYTEEI